MDIYTVYIYILQIPYSWNFRMRGALLLTLLVGGEGVVIRQQRSFDCTGCILSDGRK